MSIIVVGGGMTGAILALAISKLTNNKLPVHLIEAEALKNNSHPGFDARAIALTNGSCQQLAHIDIWKNIAYCATPINSVHISDKGHAGFVKFKTQAHDFHFIPALGQVIELYEVGIQLFSLLKNSLGIIQHCPAKVISFTRSKTNVSVILDNKTVIKGQLMIIANGSNSTLANMCGIKFQQKKYSQIAIISNIITSNKHEGRAFERFTEYGSLAMLPMSHGRCSLIWCLRQDIAYKLLSLNNDLFCYELQKNFGWKLGRINYAGKRSFYNLKLTIALKSISHRVVLVGNAAQTLHPIAGQGFNLALRDVISLVNTIAKAWYEKQDFGEYSVLNNYHNMRQHDKKTTIGITNCLLDLFSNSYTPLIVWRNAGLILLELLKPVHEILKTWAIR